MTAICILRVEPSGNGQLLVTMTTATGVGEPGSGAGDSRHFGSVDDTVVAVGDFLRSLAELPDRGETAAQSTSVEQPPP